MTTEAVSPAIVPSRDAWRSLLWRPNADMDAGAMILAQGLDICLCIYKYRAGGATNGQVGAGSGG